MVPWGAVSQMQVSKVSEGDKDSTPSRLPSSFWVLSWLFGV